MIHSPELLTSQKINLIAVEPRMLILNRREVFTSCKFLKTIDMHTPTSKQAYFVAQVFREAIERYPGLRLDMSEGEVNDGHICGTVHCHAGTYAIMRCDLDKELYYGDGAEQMARDLGFIGSFSLKEWAEHNANIWGNENGGCMFIEPVAFTSPSRPDGALSIQHIADHWNEVAQRLEAIEEN
jgi:hypothetical protein